MHYYCFHLAPHYSKELHDPQLIGVAFILIKVAIFFRWRMDIQADHGSASGRKYI